MNIKTEKEDLIEELNRANKLLEEATLNYFDMCKQVEILEQCLDEIYVICDIQLCKGKVKDLFMYCAMEDIIQKIEEVRGE